MADTCTENFSYNLKKWSLHYPEWEEKIHYLVCKNYSFCRTGKNNDLNLQTQWHGSEVFVHSAVDAVEEARSWFSDLNLSKANVLYVYGVGLGYYYQAAKDWLDGNKNRFLIFLEDDLEILHRFLETDIARSILSNHQVRVVPIELPTALNDKGLDYLTTAFLLDLYSFSTLPFSNLAKAPIVHEVSNAISYFYQTKGPNVVEYLQGSSVFFNNYYRNLLELPSSYLGNQLRGKFANIPAIICGAGPSLAKNIGVLKKLEDRALIFAGGTSMNVLNSFGVQANFGIVVDPNETQMSRLIANTAFQTPFFYRNRVYHEALNCIQGDHLYVNGVGGYKISDWMEQKLGIQDTHGFIDEGYNVVNFTLSIAKMLGCNPIILVGVDLAYSDNYTYAPGMKFHALYSYKNSMVTRHPDEEMILVKDINGNPVYTLWKWINEAKWYSDFAKSNSDVILVNCTEGGIGFKGIQDLPLAVAAKIHLNECYDLESLVHTEIQNSAPPESVNEIDILKTLQTWSAGLTKSEGLLKQISEHYGAIAKEILFNESKEEYLNLSDISLLLKDLEKQPVKKYFIDDYIRNFMWVFSRRMKMLQKRDTLDKETSLMADAKLEEDCYAFVCGVCQKNNYWLQETTLNHQARPSFTPREILRDGAKKPVEAKGEKKETFYPDGKIKSEQYFIDGMIEGPSLYYGQEGQLLVQAQYKNGVRDGEAYYYYKNGALYAIKRYSKGLPHGKQEYYYRDGSLRSEIPFREGKLNGTVRLYYPNGQMKREMSFADNSREGPEKMWGEIGNLLIDVTYKEDGPLGEGRWWYNTGRDRHKVTYPPGYDHRSAMDPKIDLPVDLEKQKKELDGMVDIAAGLLSGVDQMLERIDSVMLFFDEKDQEKINSLCAQLISQKEKLEEMIKIYIRKQADDKNPDKTMQSPTPLKDEMEIKLMPIVKSIKDDLAELSKFIHQASETFKLKERHD